ncbi:MAG: DegT/DnrJ/EryC1/StrS family aminotransferase [Deltaproteobacteria bacterium]|nr:DegT/DnrJ/EryC1/StrS family aminotransferase [Deltaproteobacteria bacterium]
MIGEEERRAVAEVLDGPILVHGPRATEFEKAFAAFTGAAHAVSVSSCTAALHLAYFYLGIGPGDEVIVPAQTHTATAHAVELCGAKPVFVDSEGETGNIDIEEMKEKISDKTKAISVVHYLGMPVDMSRVCETAKQRGLFVVEDCALAIGTYFHGIHAGLHGDVGCFSFYPVKHMTTAEGGMLVTKEKRIAERIARQKAFGVDRHMGERKIPGVYDVTMLGFNYRMNEIQAALGTEQLKKMDAFLEKRKENYMALSRGVAGIEEAAQFQSSQGEYESSYYCHSVRLKKNVAGRRFEIVDSLKAQGVGTSVYYPKPVPHMTYYRDKYGYGEDSFPVAASISYGSIALPVGPHLTVEDMAYMVDALKKAIREVQ